MEAPESRIGQLQKQTLSIPPGDEGLPYATTDMWSTILLSQVLLSLRVQAGPKVLHDYAIPTWPVCHSRSKCHPWPGWSHSKPSHCQLSPTHRKGMHLLVFQQRSSRAEGLPTLLDFKLCLECVELPKMSSLPDQVCTALLHVLMADMRGVEQLLALSR